MSEYRIKYDKTIMGLFERCIKLGYKPYFHMPHKTPRGYEIETLLIIGWIEGHRIDMIIGMDTNNPDRWGLCVNSRTCDFSFILKDEDYFTTKQEAQLAAIEKGLEILES